MSCTNCGAVLDGSHAVRDGEPFCFDCEDPLEPPRSSDVAPPQTIAEFQERKATQIDVSALLNGGDAR